MYCRLYDPSTPQDVPAATPTATCPVLPRVPVISINSTPVKYAQLNEVSLGCREFGGGEPLLMITGFGASMDGWNQTFISVLASKYHVYIYDHRGMGNSSDNNVTPTMSQYADDAAGLMTALGYESMHIYGVSMGSSISQQLVIDHPERVRKLVLNSNVYSIRIPETKKLLGSIEAVNADSTLPGDSATRHRQISRGMGPGTAFLESIGCHACCGYRRLPHTRCDLSPYGRADQWIMARAVQGTSACRI